ncbi:lytic polysaccharide monooxygenase [Candidatus Arsenophonus nilaparvatae]|uniref:lytic polysaccharide monooxygenase n=1 Tax=Candidatus Arsenophonus nilaparvatae TaxID=1247023 RepID=UPI0005097886|nr:lytic polysaccharide monooxygenase [Candidatus Arsenophonus nilaparvatae]
MKNNFLLMLFILIVVTAFSSVSSNRESMHGFVYTPKSRSVLCWIEQNDDCGSASNDPMSIEGASGFPKQGAKDGRIASGDNFWFSQLDQQNSDRWHKNNIKVGKNIFEWFLTQPNYTVSWEFYITKQDWDPNAPLTRDSFESKPFCLRSNDGKKLTVDEMNIECDVPKRSGYQIILGIWTIADTGSAFYQVIDVNISDI